MNYEKVNIASVAPTRIFSTSLQQSKQGRGQTHREVNLDTPHTYIWPTVPGAHNYLYIPSLKDGGGEKEGASQKRQ